MTKDVQSSAVLSTKKPARLRWLGVAIVFCLPAAGASADGLSLMQVYQLAEQNDQQLRAAEQQRLSIQQNIPIEQADFLPQISGEAGLDYSRTDITAGAAPGRDTIDGSSRNLGLGLTQTLYNQVSSIQLDLAQLQAQQADVDYNVARQDLILRTGEAYFGVLEANARLKLAQANRTAVKRQLERAQRQYEVGLVAVTDVADAQAQYDQADADIITAENALNNALTALESIIGQPATTLYDVKTNLDVVSPEPADLHDWVDMALQQNLPLMSGLLGKRLARETVGLNRAQRMPTVDLQGRYGYDNSPSQSTGNRTETLNGQIGVQVNLPIYTGGRINAQTRQAAYDFQQVQFEIEDLRRQVRQSTSDNYRAVNTSISQISAFQQAVESARTSLAATEAGYNVGTRTIVDLLNAELQVFSAMADFLDARYAYIVNFLRLKADTGQLSVADLEAFDQQLTDEPTNALIAPILGGDFRDDQQAQDEMLRRVLERARRTVEAQD